MHVQTSGPWIRVLGTLTGVGFLLIGAFAIFGADNGTVSAELRSRSTWFGVTAIIAGAWAIAVSWLDPDLSGVWCRPPRRARDPESPSA
jgi:hypothetical protein